MPKPTPAPAQIHIALLGGAFDPPTLGHIDVATFVMEEASDVGEVWLVPPARHRFAKPMAPAHDRLAMCRLAAAGEPRIRVFDYEIVRNLPGDTFAFIGALFADRAYAGHRFSFIIGQDNADTFDRWHRADELRGLIPFIVVPRSGVEPVASADRWFERPPHRLLKGRRAILKTSSTAARAAVASGSWKTALTLASEPVLGYIREHRLYGATGGIS